MNWFQGLQHAMGINIVDVAAWIGIAWGTLWFWTATRVHNNLFPDATPLEWLGSSTRSLGANMAWPDRAQGWFESHHEIFWLLVIAAAFLAGRSARGARSLGSVAVVSLLLASCIRGGAQSLTYFVLLSMAMCVAAIAADFFAERQSQDGVLCIPGISFRILLQGPIGLALLIPLSPLLLIIAAVRDYRSPGISDALSGFEFASAVSRLPDTALKDTPARVVMSAFAETILMVGEDEAERADAIWSLRDNRKGPTGAVGLGDITD